MGQSTSRHDEDEGTARSEAAPNIEEDGLLQNSSRTGYASSINSVAAAAALLVAPGLLYHAAALDAGSDSTMDYFRRVHKSLLAYIKTNAVCDRDGTMLELTRLMQDEGQFVEFVGARNIGKSHMLAKLAEALNAGGKHLAIVIDARLTGSDVAAAILASLEGFGRSVVTDVLRELSNAAAAAIDGVLPGGGVGAAARALSGSAAAPATSGDLVHAFLRYCAAKNKYPVIVLDEMGVLEFSSADASAVAKLRDLLALFTVIAKQQKKANVIVATSGFAENARFKLLKLSCEITKVVAASEVPPGHMLSLLQSCACGPHLAAALAAVYSGSVWTAYKALGALASSEEVAREFEAIFALTSEATGAPSACMETAGVAGPKLAASMAALLLALARDGFVPLSSPRDECAVIVRSSGVGGVVARAEHFSGAQPAAWTSGKHLYILTPSCQATRLLLCGNLAVQSASPALLVLPAPAPAAASGEAAVAASVLQLWWKHRPSPRTASFACVTAAPSHGGSLVRAPSN
jgi:hypothetical protein